MKVRNLSVIREDITDLKKIPKNVLRLELFATTKYTKYTKIHADWQSRHMIHTSDISEVDLLSKIDDGNWVKFWKVRDLHKLTRLLLWEDILYLW